MLSVEIVCVGKLNQSGLREACEEYEKRLGAFCRLTVTELAETRLAEDGEAAQRKVVETESARILEHIGRKRTLLAAMCVEGREMTSPQLAAFFADAAMTCPDVTFVVGGSLGLSEELKARAQLRLSMSRMIFPHQLARLMLLEQIYRACTINANVKYHK